MISQIQDQIGNNIGADGADVRDSSINQRDSDRSDRDQENKALIEGGGINIKHIAGVVDQLEIARLKRLIFRSTKGKSYMYVQQYDDGQEQSRKSVYIIVF